MAYDENGFWISDDKDGSDWATGSPTTGGYPGTTGWTPGGDLPGGGDETPPWLGGPAIGSTGGNWWDMFTGGGGGGGGGSSGGDWWDKILKGAQGATGGMDPTALAMLGPALTTAYKQWTDVDRYRDSAKDAVKASDPYRDRDMYADRLKRMTEDPNAYLKDSPDYQAALKQGIGGVERSQAAQGYLGSGNMLTALNDYSAETAAKYLDRDRQSLMQMAKGNPNAGDYIMRGDENAIKSQNAALGSLFSPFGAMMGGKGGGTTINNNNGGGGSGGGPGGGPGSGSPINPSSIVSAINAGGPGAMQAISQAISAGMRFIPGGDGSTIDLWAAARAGGQGGEPGNSYFYPWRSGDDEWTMPAGGGDIPPWDAGGGAGDPGWYPDEPGWVSGDELPWGDW